MLFDKTLHAAGDTVGLRPHHDLGDLAPPHHSRRAKAFEARLVDLSRVIQNEAQTCDTALYALHIRLAAKRHEYLPGKDIIAIFH